MSTGIQWTDETWNPVVGCDQVSPGCAHCYAKELHDKRNAAMLAGKSLPAQYARPFESVQLLPERLEQPSKWAKPRRIFVNSVSDLFHDDVPDRFIARVFIAMAESERHTFQVLTKRPARMLRWFTEYLPEACSREQPAPVWPLPNVWLGVSVENQRFADERIPLLLKTPAAVRFLSCEPLLEQVEITRWLGGEPGYASPSIDWVIIGGESGARARPFDLEWTADLLAQCEFDSVPAFVKQLGDVPMLPLAEWNNRRPAPPVAAWKQSRVPKGYVPLHMGSHGADITRWPEELRVRAFPAARVPA